MYCEDTPSIPERRDSDGMNVTERKLYDALIKIGLNPESQYEVGLCKLDFAFPDCQWGFEVQGPYHFTEEGKERDKKRMQFLHHTYPPWKIRSFKAARVFNNPEGVAKEIKRILEKNPSGGNTLGGYGKPFRNW